jgi:hypothetical protein
VGPLTGQLDVQRNVVAVAVHDASVATRSIPSAP